MWEEKPDSPAAILDEIEHRRFLERCAKELTANEPPKPTPAPQPKYITQAELQRSLSKLSESIGKAVARMVVAPLEKKIAELEQAQFKFGGIRREGAVRRADDSPEGRRIVALDGSDAVRALAMATRTGSLLSSEVRQDEKAAYL